MIFLSFINLTWRFEDSHWGENAHIENIVFRVIVEDASRMIALETGDVDMILDLPPVDFDRIDSNPAYFVSAEVFNGTEYLGLNTSSGSVWSDPRARQAIAHAIDHNGIIDSVLFGAAERANSLLTSSTVGYSTQITAREQNINTARRLLAEAGVSEGAVLNLWVSGDTRQKAAEVIQANLREIGINVAIHSYEWGRFMEGTSAGEHDAYMLSWTIGTGDADSPLYSLAHSSSKGAAGNRAFYQNPQVDSLLE